MAGFNAAGQTNLANLITSLDGAGLQRLLGVLQQGSPQTPQTPQTPQLPSQPQQHPQQAPNQISPLAALSPDLASLFAAANMSRAAPNMAYPTLSQQQPQQAAALPMMSPTTISAQGNPYAALAANPAFAANPAVASLLANAAAASAAATAANGAGTTAGSGSGSGVGVANNPSLRALPQGPRLLHHQGLQRQMPTQHHHQQQNYQQQGYQAQQNQQSYQAQQNQHQQSQTQQQSSMAAAMAAAAAAAAGGGGGAATMPNMPNLNMNVQNIMEQLAKWKQ